MFVAWPMFRFGFAWLSFCNDDMANYCLVADRLLNHGFFDGPDMEDFLQGRDYMQAYWFMHVAGNLRSGGDLILATVCAVLGPKSAHQVAARNQTASMASTKLFDEASMSYFQMERKWWKPVVSNWTFGSAGVIVVYKRRKVIRIMLKAGCVRR